MNCAGTTGRTRPAAAGRAMKGQPYEAIWDLLGEMHEALDLGEDPPIIDPNDICSDDDLEYLDFFGDWTIEPGHRSISTGTRSAWTGGEPMPRARFWWCEWSGDRGATTTGAGSLR